MNIKIIELENIPINKQLEIEKNLLTSSKQTILLINKNPPPAIVLGSSQKIDEVVDKKKASEKQIPIIQRFSAGGCVIFDINTILVTFIMNNDDINDEIYPNTIMKWTEKFYKQSLPIEDFQLTANDYTIGNKKVGGNAQYIKKKSFPSPYIFFMGLFYRSYEYPHPSTKRACIP